MAITKLKSGNYQCRFRGTDGRWLSKVFERKADAEAQDRSWKQLKGDGGYVASTAFKITVNDFYSRWWEDNHRETSQSGWRRTQAHYFRDYILPVIGSMQLRSVTPAMVSKVFATMTDNGFSERTQGLVYGTLRKFFNDAIENYQILVYNPATRKLRPRESIKEAPHLNLDQVRTLLTYSDGKPYGLAIWLQIYLGLRVGELLGLNWSDIDLPSGRLVIRRVYVRATKSVRDYPKGRKQHAYTIPEELARILEREPRKTMALFPDQEGEYQRYFRVLTGYCKELGLPKLGTHGLRHSSANLYLSHGANKEDLKDFFAHSSMKMTERYLHGWQSKISEVAKVVRLFDPRSECSTNVPREVG